MISGSFRIFGLHFGKIKKKKNSIELCKRVAKRPKMSEKLLEDDIFRPNLCTYKNTFNLFGDENEDYVPQQDLHRSSFHLDLKIFFNISQQFHNRQATAR